MLSSRFHLTAALLAALSIAGSAQEAGPPAAPAGGAGGAGGAGDVGGAPGPSRGGGGNSTGPIFGGGNSPGSQPNFPDIVRPVFLSGKVLLENGEAPPSEVAIQRMCLGAPVTEGYTDSKGRFSFELGRQMGVVIDASQSSFADVPSSMRTGSQGGQVQNSAFGGPQQQQFTERDLAMCEIRASLPGYLSNPISLAGRRIMDNPDIGTFILHPLAGVSGFTFSATSGLAPKDAKKAFEKGSQLIGKKKYADAQKELEKAVAAYPKYAAAWTALGSARLGQNNLDGAMEAWSRSIASDERYLTPHLELMQAYGNQSKWPELQKTSARVIQLNAVQYPQAYFYHAVAQFNLKEYDEAEKAAAEAVRLDTQHRWPRAELILGILLARRSDNEGALQILRGYATRVKGADLEQAQQQIAAIEKRIAQ